MGTVECILQAKGGVGKSLVATLLFQYFQGKGVQTTGVDTDPLNATFAGFEDLEIIRLNVMNGDEIDGSLFDSLVESALLMAPQDRLVIDNGSSNFVKLFSYLKYSEAFSVILEAGHEVRLHTVIVGGPAAEETFYKVRDLAVEFPNIQQVIWKNLFFGPVILKRKTFEETTLYNEFGERFHAVIEIPNLEKDTFGKDLETLLADKLSFQRAISGNNYQLMTRQRLKIFWKLAQEAMDKANLV
jgi:hypothetical protein